MKHIVLLISIAAFFFAACSKTNPTNANVLFYNGTWSLSAITAAWNNVDIVTTAIPQGQGSGVANAPYVPVPAGTNLVTLKAGTNSLLDKNIYAGGGSASSFIFFDTSMVASPAAPARILQLTDDLSLPDTGKIKYRILNLVPDTSVHADIWLVNGVTDSVRLDSANSFIGVAALAADVQTFDSTAYQGQSYTLKVKKTATEQVYASFPNCPFTVKGLYSIIFSGLLTGTGNTALKLSILQHHTR